MWAISRWDGACHIVCSSKKIALGVQRNEICCVSWHWTASFLLIWKGMRARGLPVLTCLLCLEHLSPAWWTDDFSTPVLQALEIIANYLVELRWVTVLFVFPCHQVFLTSVGDCSQFSTPFPPGNLYPVQLAWHLPQSAMASTFSTLSQRPLYPFKRFPTTASLWKDCDSLENIF